MDRIDAMRAFISVVNENTFTGAAEHLDTSPQLVSKYVSQLEKHLGVRLLNRTTRRVHLTEAGRRYFERATQVLTDIEEMESELGEMQTQARGQLRISAPVSFAVRHMAPLLCAFQKAHPAVDIDLQLNDRKVDIVEEGFDIALRIGHLRSSSLIARKIAPVRIVTCASPAYLDNHGLPQTLDQLSGHHYLRYSYMDSSSNVPLFRALQSIAERGEGHMSSNNGDVLLEAAVAGAGIAVQPTFITGPAVASGQLQVILEEYAPEPLGLYAIYAHRQLLASKVRAFIDFMEGYFGDPPYWDRFDLPRSGATT